MKEFEDLVTVQLNIYQRKVKYMINPSINKSASYVNYFVQHCKNTYGGVEHLAEHINKAVTKNCQLHNGEVFIKATKLFGQLEEKFNITGWRKQERQKKNKPTTTFLCQPL
ncbi:unnamed protein product [Bursaphelenchus okinawaensis]|uniref:Uncharacterized protein n=1 Tax=Bursaphelenchus okinawaensis TaxID=465554 RepID=A0A811K9R3_9BILA|nr:unnamed protein product [Bursaphelenchus okinawaensis]CAG9097665.1 unnamed protein product [Bursaphelenchus okinawaensis]